MLNRGDSPTMAFVGDTNTGKSMKALRLCEILYDELDMFEGEWTAEENLVYEVLPFLETMRDIPTPDSEQAINPKRKAIIFDEGGVNLNSKDHMKSSNRGVDEVLQTMRIKNCLYMFVTPNLRDLDTSIRKDLDFVVSVKSPGFAFINSVEQIRDRFDTKFERAIYNWGYWTPDMPSKNLVEQYRGKEYPHKEGFIKDRIEKMEQEKMQEELDSAAEIL